MPKRRIFQVNELLRQEIGQIVLMELSDPRFTQVTVSGVQTSADLRHAKVYFHHHGTESEHEETRDALQRASGRMRHLLGKRIRLKNIPELNFRYDDRLDYAEKIYHTLSELHIEPEEKRSEDEHPEQDEGEHY